MANNGKTTSTDIAQNILDAFDIIAKAEVNSAQFDKTVLGIIVSCEDAASGRYKVQYQNSIFYAYSSALDITYTKGTSVQVKIPNNDFSGRKIIIGTADALGVDYGTVIEDPLLRYEYIGGNCIFNNDSYLIGSYWDEKKNNVVLYDKDKNINKVGLNTDLVYQYIKEGNSVILGATIKTDIDELQRFEGDYGIKYTLTFEDITKVSTDGLIDREYIIDIDKMSGDPYAYDVASEQLVPFDVDSENFVWVKKIELFAKHFPNSDNTKPGDIEISNLKFLPAYRIPDEEFAGTRLSIVCEEGNYFNAAEGTTKKPAKAVLRINGSIVENIKQMEFYWFIEDLRVNQSSNINYHKYGGRGWKCLNKFNSTETKPDPQYPNDEDKEIPVKVQYISDTQVRQINRDETKARNTRYKCAVVYKGSVFTKEFIFTNETSNINTIIKTDRDPNFKDGIGAVTLTCVVENAAAASYNWAKVDYEGGFNSLLDTPTDNSRYEDNVKNKANLQADMASNKKPNNAANQTQLEIYEKIIREYDNKMRQKENQIINLQANSIFQKAIFKCQAFDKDGISLGIAEQQVTNMVSTGEDQKNSWLTITNGVQVFRYNAKGISPTSNQWEEPQQILPLSFVLRNAEGDEIPHDAIRDEDVLWTVPIENTMLKKYTGSLVTRDEEKGVEIYKGKSLSYTINDNYYSQKDNNEIQLQVKYKNRTDFATTNILFIKDGEDGTNGTEFVLKIIPTLDNIGNDTRTGRLKTVKLGQQGNDWFKAELWYNGIRLHEPTSALSVNAINGAKIKYVWSMAGDKRATHNVNYDKKLNPNWYCNGAVPLEQVSTRKPTDNDYINGASDIVKLTCEYTLNNQKMSITATQPIIVVNSSTLVDNYKVSLKKGTGFTHVTYSEDGLIPDYDSKIPFELEVWKKEGNVWSDISKNSKLTFNWSTIGQIKIKKDYTSSMRQVMAEVEGKYNSENVNHAIQCQLKYDGTNLGLVHIPIHFLLNKYGHSAINEWDGNSIQLDANGNTMLLAPQGGFGKKNDDNSYTGLLLGTVKEYYGNGSTSEHTGMFAYNEGKRTMYLNAENGSANFGQVGSSQIIIDPANDKNNHARLYSGIFYKDDGWNEKTGLPKSYGPENEPWYANRKNYIDDAHAQQAEGRGMMIDLTEPSIQWGNRNFYVTKEGYINARGGGHIAGWHINNFRIYSNSDNTGMSSVSQKDGEGVTQWQVYHPTLKGNAAIKPIAFWAGSKNQNGAFHVAHDGYVRMSEATIGKNNGNLIYVGEANGHSAIYTMNKQSFNANGNGFYLGTNGIGLGTTFNQDGTTVSNFQVTSDGEFVARNGYIGGRSKGWRIEDTYMYNGKPGLKNGNDGVYIGTDGIALGRKLTVDGHSPFEVDNKGNFVARNGYIGNGKNGWTVTDTKIYNGKDSLNSDTAGIYLDTTQGIGIGKGAHGGSAFYVQTNGNFYARTGFIGDSDQGWRVEQNNITNNNVRIHAGTGLAFTAGGLDENSPFWIKHDGSIKATSGTIAGWNIDDSNIKGGNVTMNKGGNIDCSGGKGWFIHSDGSARFGELNIYANGEVHGPGFVINSGTTTKIDQIEGKVINLTGQLAAASAQLSGALTAGGAIKGSSVDTGSGSIKGGAISGSSFSSGGKAGLTTSQWVMTGWNNPTMDLTIIGTATRGDGPLEWAHIYFMTAAYLTAQIKLTIPFTGRNFEFTSGLLTGCNDTGTPTLTVDSGSKQASMVPL